MKQTSNAIKFLLAQYRAIFKSAYFKGLATAAVVTVGLAAGQAQADDKIINNSNIDELLNSASADIVVNGLTSAGSPAADENEYTKIYDSNGH